LDFIPGKQKISKTRRSNALQVVSDLMSALARTTEIDCYTRAANEDCINGGPRTRTKYAYDANGNVKSRSGSIIGWTSYNYPAGVGTSTESATFDYGPDRQRWRMFYSGPSGTETTYYLTPKFEVVLTSAGTDYRHYLYANGRPVTVISRTTAGAVSVRSLLADQQGSISSIVTDATGASLVSESFTPYGNRREASTWSGTPTSTELSTMNGVTREGYTFQTVLGSMGLNHMNARIEDSITGRFLSPDPRGTIPGNTQSWNRYSYVNNNPLTFTDPTGFDANCPEGGCVKPNNPPPPPDPREGFAAFGSESSCLGACFSYSTSVGEGTVDGVVNDRNLQVFVGPTQNTNTFIGSWHSNGMWGDAENPFYSGSNLFGGFAGSLTAGFGGAGFAAPGGGSGGGAGVGSGSGAGTAGDPGSAQRQQNQSCWAAGISFSFSTINPVTSGGGGTYGLNVEWTTGGGLAVFTYGTPDATPSQGFLLSSGVSINGAVGKGPWSGLFNSTTGAYGPVSGGFFQSPPGGDDPGYFGLEARAGPGLPGVGSTTTNYTPRIQLTHPAPNNCTGKP
jgi:RHS repeat-associated protein